MLSFEPYYKEAFSNSLISFIISLLAFLDYIILFADALMSIMSSEGITMSASIFLETLDLFMESIVLTIYLLKATSCKSVLSLCSIISFFLLICSFKYTTSFSNSLSLPCILLILSSKFWIFFSNSIIWFYFSFKITV